MSDMDDRLQQQLSDLESGTPLETLLEDETQDAAELKPLLRLAAAVREGPHPDPSREHSRVLEQKFNTAARDLAGTHKCGPFDWLRSRWVLVPVLAGVALIFLCAFGSLGIGLLLAGPRNAHAATLVDVVGQVEVASSVTATDWRPIADGAQVRSGQRLRTLIGASATLVFFEGSRTMLSPATDLTLTHVAGNWGSVLQVEMLQATGRTSHRVVPLRGKNSQFMVNTPAGTASVRGTAFNVAVDTQGRALFTVDAGQVLVTNVNQAVAVAAGQSTLSQPEVAPETPAYQFHLYDQLTAIESDSWNVSGVSFQVTDQTMLTNHPQVGDYIFVQGRIREGENWVADRIEPSSSSAAQFLFTGIVETIGRDTWQINGVTVLVNEVTEIQDGITVGKPVKVTYTILDGDRWLALKIEALDPDSQPAPSSSTATPTGTLTPASTPINCTGNVVQPKGQELAQKYAVPYAEIMSWFCQGFGFGEIDLAYGLSREYNVSVAEIFALRSSGLGWGEIKHRLALTPTPTIAATLPITPTPTLTATLPIPPTATPTVTPTPSPTPVLSPTPATTQTTDCTGANPQPKGQALAIRYGVPYAEIMGWFCQGFGFGEIDLAYSLSNQTSTPVAQIFAMKQSGLGWGEIKKQLTGTAKPPKKKP